MKLISHLKKDLTKVQRRNYCLMELTLVDNRSRCINELMNALFRFRCELLKGKPPRCRIITKRFTILASLRITGSVSSLIS